MVIRIEPPGAPGVGMSTNCPGPGGRNLNGSSSAVVPDGPAVGGGASSVSSLSTESPSSYMVRARDFSASVMKGGFPVEPGLQIALCLCFQSFEI